MRITTQMLNASAQKAGMPVNTHSLLDYVNNKNHSSMLDGIQSGASGRLNKMQKTKYEKQEEAASQLDTQVKKFMDDGEDSLFKKAVSDGDVSKLRKETEALVKKYNDLLASMKDSDGALNEFYKKSLKDLAGDHQEALAALGITSSKDGSLQIDADTLEKAPLEAYEKAFGKDAVLPERLSFLASRITDQAEANLESLSGSYLPNGNAISSYTNKHDFWG